MMRHFPCSGFPGLFRVALLTLLIWAAAAVGLRADELADYRLVVTHDGAQVSFSLAELRALPQQTLVTHTLYTDGPQEFIGPRLSDVIEAAGFSGKTVIAIAINDYIADIPYSDLTEYGVIAAMTMNGEPMTVRDKGPVWIVYPRDSYSLLRRGDHEYRWVWQLVRLDVE